MPAVAIRKNKQRLLEVSYSSDLKVDLENGVIRGVKILGRESANGRSYSDNALLEAAVLYDGRGVNLDHDRTGKERKVAEGFGRIRNPEVRSDGVYGDLEFLKTHPMAEQVCEAAERMPEQLGMSHDAEGTVSRQNGRLVVESITGVNYVDMVRRPATSAGLFESNGGKQMTLLASTQIREEEHMLPATDAMAAEPEAEVDPNEEVKAALDKAAMAILKKALDGGIELSEAFTKIKDLMGTKEKATGEGEGEASVEAPVPEGHRTGPAPQLDPKLFKLQEQVNRLEGEAKAKELLETADIAPRPAYVAALIGAKTPEEQNELLEEWPKRAGVMSAGRPAQSSPLHRLREDTVKYPDTHEGFLKSIK